MTKKELENTINSIMARGNPEYTTPSGAFLEVLRDIAKQNRIDAIAECISVYCKAYPIARNFIIARVPGILVNHNFTMRTDLDYDKFIQWSVTTANWAEGIIANALDGNGLKMEVENIITLANNFNRNNL